MNTICHSKTWLALLLACGASLPGNLLAQSQPSPNLARPLEGATDSARGGVVMVSPGEDLNDAQKMADGNINTSYAFLPTDPAPMAVIDLGETRPVSRVNAAFKAGPGQLSIYLVADPALQPKTGAPDATGAGDAKTIGDVVAKDFPGTRTPVLSVDTGKPAGLNRAGANVNNLTGRYVVMMFKPTGPVAAADAPDYKDRDFKDFKDTDASQAPAAAQQPLEVAEISALGPLGPGVALISTPFNPPAQAGTTKPAPPTGPPVFPPSSGNGVVSP